MAQAAPAPTDAMLASQNLMRALFPAGVRSAFSDARHQPPAIYAEEAQSVAHAVPSRQREFALGRWCARAALAQHGVAPTAIPVAKDRSPVWPHGFVGSIAHCAGFVGAVVAHAEHIEAIGFDVEPAVPLDADLVPLVCTPAEMQWMQSAPPPAAADWGKVLFSAKEAIHKCIAPRSGVMLEFRDVEVSVRPLDGTFSSRLLTSAYPTLPNFARLLGRFAIGPVFVATAATIAASP